MIGQSHVYMIAQFWKENIYVYIIVYKLLLTHVQNMFVLYLCHNIILTKQRLWWVSIKYIIIMKLKTNFVITLAVICSIIFFACPFDKLFFWNSVSEGGDKRSPLDAFVIGRIYSGLFNLSTQVHNTKSHSKMMNVYSPIRALH